MIIGNKMFNGWFEYSLFTAISDTQKGRIEKYER